MANTAMRSGVKIKIALMVFTPTLSAQLPVIVLVGVDSELVGRRVELELVVPPDPFNLFAFLTNAWKFSQSESFALIAPTPP